MYISRWLISLRKELSQQNPMEAWFCWLDSRNRLDHDRVVLDENDSVPTYRYPDSGKCGTENPSTNTTASSLNASKWRSKLS